MAELREFVDVIVFLILGLACTPIVVDQVQGLNTTAWEFTGYEGAITLIELVPFIYVVAILMATIVWGLKKRSAGAI